MIAFIHIKKTAGKTIKHIMQRELGIFHCDAKRWHPDDPYFSAADLARLRRIYPWLRSIAGHSVRAYGDLQQASPAPLFYTFLRDPVRRTVSQYQYEMRKARHGDKPFEDWLADPARHNLQVQSLAGTADLDEALRILEHEVTFVGLQEQFEESLLLLRPALGLPERVDLSPVRVNAASDNRLRDRILADPKRVALLQQANQLDQALYDYARNTLFERQRERLHPLLTSAPDSSRVRRRSSLSARSYANGAYRYLVYKPLIEIYRSCVANRRRQAQ